MGQRNFFPQVNYSLLLLNFKLFTLKKTGKLYHNIVAVYLTLL